MQARCVAGVDAGQRFLDLGLAPSGQTARFHNTQADIARLVARLRQAGVARVVLEAIGHYAQPVVQALVEAGLQVGIVNPRRIKAFREAEGRRAKTDRLDAGLIARFALVMSDAVRPLPDADAQALKALSVRRRQLTELIAIEKTRLKQPPSRSSLKATRPPWRRWPRPARRSRPRSQAASPAIRSAPRRSACCARCRASARGSVPC